ncbi:MAG: hypothetical protein IJJ76_08395 [Ruminococcus sp.]|uniref:hypothetical protein n=1 Tax=Ruminococcus sp. TaxID=41978 RepID=UPI0025EC9FB5|nr:hypothetical protein [Ruminococcus sp.]MBR0529766.1 hypothetical protein [Ruminococcus sp.]
MKRLYHYTPMLILTIFAAVFMVLTQLLIFCQTMVLNTDYYVWTISDSGAEEALYNEVSTYFRQYSIPTDIPQDVYMKSLDKTTITVTAKRLTKTSLDYVFGNTHVQPQVQFDFTDFENDVTDYIEKYSDANNIVKDAEYYSFIDNTLENAEAKIENSFDIMMAQKLSESGAASISRRIVPKMKGILVISCVVLLALLAIMYYIDRHHPFDMPYWIGVILFVGSALLLIPAIYCRYTGYFDGLFLTDESIYYAITGAIYGVTDRLILVNCILFGLGVVLIIFAQIIHIFRVREAMQYHHHHHDDDDEADTNS